MEIAKLYITLAADASSYQGTLQQVDRDTTSWASGLADRMSKTLGTAILAAVAAMTIAIGFFFISAVDKAADLEAQMDTVAALLGATAEQAELLRQATIDLALDPNLKVSATEAAQAIEMLAQNGLTVEEILGGAARATVLLANATGADFTTAARIATDAMALWGMEAGDLEQVANGVTAVLVQSKFEVNDYALALAQAGGVASAVGVSFEDFNATLVAIAPYFASGSDAGTSYKTMLQRLIPTTSSAKDAMAALGLITEDGANAFFDSQGNMRSMAEVAGILHGALGGLSEQQRLQALSTIFGTDAMRAAVAMSQFTKEEFERLQAVMANTSAAEIAAQRMQNFSGAMEIVEGVVEGLQLQLGNVLLPILTKLALEGANLLAAWGPPLIAAFERLVTIFGEFFTNIQSGMSIWGALKSALMDIGNLLGMTADEAIAFAAGVTNVVQAIVGFIAPIAQAIASFVSWKDAVLAFGLVALWAVGSVLLPMLAPIAGIVAAVAGLALVFAAVRTAWENDFLGIRSAVEGVVETIQRFVGAFQDSFRDSGDVIGALVVAFQNLVGPTSAMGQAFLQIGEKVREFVGVVQGVFQPTIERIKEAFGGLGDNMAPVGEKLAGLKEAFWGLLQALAPVGVAIAAVVGVIAKFLGEVLAGVITNAGTIIGGLVTFATGMVDGVANAVQTLVGIVRSLLTGDWAGVWEAAKGFVAGWVDATRTQLEGLGQVVDGIMATLWDAVVNTISDLTGATLPSWEEFKQSVGDSLSGIEETIRPILEGIAGLFAPTVERIKEAFIGLGDSFAPVGDKLQTLWQSFQDLASAVGQVLLPVLVGLGAALVVVGKFLGEVFAGLLANAGQIVGGAVDAITGAIQGLTSVVQGVVDVVTALLQGDWAGAWEAAKTAASGLAEGVETALNGLLTIVDGIMATLWDAVVNTISDLTGATLPSWEEFKQSVSTAISGVVESIRTALQPVVDLFAPTIERIKEAFGGLGDSLAPVGDKLGILKEAFGRLGEALQPVFSVLQQVVGFIGGVMLGTLQTVGAVVGAVVGVIAKFLGEVLAGIISNAGTIIGGLVTVITGIVDGVSNAISAVVAIVRGVLEGDWQAVWNAAVEFVRGWLGSIGTVLSGLGEIVDGVLGAAWDAIANTINDLTGATIPSWEEFKTSIVTKITEIAVSIREKVEEWKTSFSTFIDNVRNLNIGESIKTFITEGLTNIAEAIREKVTEWVGKFTGFVEEVGNANVGQSIVDKIIEGLGNFVTSVGATLAGWLTSFVNWVNTTDASIKQVGIDIVNRVIEGLAQFAATVGATLTGWYATFTTWVSGIDWYQVGYDIVSFIVYALTEFPSEAAATMADWAQTFWDWATDTAGDLYDAGVEIVVSIVEGLGEFVNLAWDTMTEWAQTFWDWATETASNLWDAGVEIVTQIVEGLKEFPALAWEAMTEWAQAFWDWAADTASDLWDAGVEIVTEIAEGLKEFPGLAWDAMSEWAQAFWDWVSDTAGDLWQAGVDIVEKIIEGLKEFPTLVVETLSTWITSFATWVGSSIAQLVIIGSAIVTHIVTGLADFWTKAVTTVSGWFTSLSTYVSGKIEEIKGLGRSIVEGIISGIMEMAQAVINAASGVIQGGIQAIRDALGDPHSPAPALIPLGASISEGVAAGIILTSGMVTDAIQKVASAMELEGVTAFGEAMKAIAEGVASAMSAILDIGSFRGAGEGFGAAMQALVDMMAAMVAAVAKANTYTAEVLENLGAFVEVAGDIGDLLTDTGEIVDTIGRWRAPDLAAVNGSIELLVGFLGEMVRGVLSLVDESTLVLSVLGDFLDSAGQLPELFMGVADITSYLAGWRAPNLEPVVGNINTLAGVLGVLVDAIARTNTMGLGMLEILATFTDTAAGVVALIAPLADAMRDIATFPAGAELGVMQRGIDTMVFYLTQIVTAVAGANVWGQMALENLGTFVEVAGDIVGLIGPMAEAMFGIANFPQGTDVQVMARNIEVMAGYLHDLVAAITESNTWGQLSLDLLGTFVDVAGSIAELITPLAEAIWNIANFQAPDLMAFIGNLSTIANRLSEMVAWFNSGVNYSVAALDALGQYIEVMADIADGMSAFIDAIAAIAAFEPPDLLSFIGNVATLAGHLSEMVAWFNNGVNLSQAALEALGQYIEVMTDIAEGVASFVDAVAAIVAFEPPDLFVFQQAAATLAGQIGELVIWFNNGVNLSQAALEALGQYVEVVGDLVDLIADAIEALGLIAAYSSDTAALGPAIAAFARDLMTVVETLVTGFNSASASARTAILAAGDFADAVGDILGVVEDGVDALVALAGYIPSTDLAATTQRFAADLVLVINTIVAALQAAGVLANAAITAAGDMADALGDIVGVVEPAVEAVVYLVGYVQVGGLQQAAQQFAADLVIVVTTLADGFREAGLATNSAVLEAGEMAGKLDDLLSIVEPALHKDNGAITLIAKYVSDADLVAKAQQFTADLLMVAQTLVDGLTQSTLAIGVALAKAGEMGKSLKDLFDAIKPALKAIEDIAAYTSAANLAKKAQQFTDDLVATTTVIVTGLSTAANQLGAPAIEAAQGFALAAQAITTAVAGAFTSLTELADIPTNSGLSEKVGMFAQQLVGATLALATALATAAQTIGMEALATAAKFAADAATLLGAVNDALAALSAIGENELAAGLSAKIQVFGQQLIDMTTYLALGLGSAAARLGEGVVADALLFATSAATILQAVNTALVAMVAIGDNKLADGLSAKIQVFGQQLIDTTTFLALSLGAAAGRLGESVVADALSFAADSATISQAVDAALKALAALAANELAAGMGARIQALGQQLVDMATYLATSLAAAARALGPEIVAAAAAFAAAVTGLVHEVTAAVAALAQLAGVERPNIDGVVSYIVVSADQIRTAFSTAGDIGQAVAYAAAFRANLTQLVAEVQGAAAQLNALAGVGTTGSIGAALANIAASLMNTQGQFTGSGMALANALIEALRGGVSAGEGAVVQATVGVLTAALNAGLNEAREFSRVGDAIIDAMVSGIQSGQAQVVAAVVQVVGAAIAAGINEAKRAADVGRQVIQAALAEINAGRGQLDAAGAAAGDAMIDGMARAITSGRSRLVNAIIATVNAAVAAARAALGIASPSRVAEALFGNFMATAELALSDPRGLVAAIGKSTRVMVQEAARAVNELGRMVTPPMAMPMPAGVGAGHGGGQTVRLTQPSLGAGTTSAATGPRASAAPTPVYNFYGDFVVEGVQDGPGLLEQLAALTAGARR